MCIISCLAVDCLFIFLLLLFICFFICYYHADNAWQIKVEYANKKKKSYFTHLPGSPPWTYLDEIWHSGRVLDVDNCAIFINWFRGLYSVWVKFCRSPLTSSVTINAALLYSAPVTTITGSNLRLYVKARSKVDHRHRFRRRFKSSAVSRQKNYVIYQNNRMYCGEAKSCNKYTCCCLDGQPANDAHGLYVYLYR